MVMKELTLLFGVWARNDCVASSYVNVVYTVVSVRYKQLSFYSLANNSRVQQCFGKIVGAPSPLKPGFDSTTIHVGFMVNKVPLGQSLSPSVCGFPYRCHYTNVCTLFLCVYYRR